MAIGKAKLAADYTARKNKLQTANRMKPQLIEKVMGYVCAAVMIANISFKLQSRTLIFILNPCHAANAFLIYLTMTDYSGFGEVVALAVYGFSFGGWIGLAFSENEGLPFFEVLVYYI